MEAPSQNGTSPLETKLSELEREIKRVEADIAEVVSQLKPLEKKPLKERDEDEKAEIARLSKEKKQLREKEKQLRDEKKQLREEKARLEERQQQSREANASSSSTALSERVLLGLEELALNQRELSTKVDALKTTELSISESQIGANILRVHVPVDVSKNAGAGAAVLTDEEANHLRTLAPEKELVQYLTPKLVALIPTECLQVLVNSETHAWIETGLEPKFFRKPDLFVVLSSFWASRGGEERRSDEGVLASWKLRDGVAVLMEAKLTKLHDVIGQIVTGMQHLCKNEGYLWKRFGIALMSKEFYVLEFCGDRVYRIEKCAWNGRGGKEVLKKALSHMTFWSTAATKICDSLGLVLVGDGKGFLGMGAFGRVVKCMRQKDQKMVALKMFLGEEKHAQQLEIEFAGLFQARRVCEYVIEVGDIAKIGQIEGLFFCGYTMELGEDIDVSSPKVRRACLEALMQIHLCGWCHGDARAANVVKMKQGYKFIDFLLAYSFSGRDGSHLAARDVSQFIKSLYARVQRVSSPDVKLPTGISKLIEDYAKCFVALIDRGNAEMIMSDIIKECEEKLCKADK